MQIKVDKNKLYSAILTRGLSLREVSRAIGYHEDYIASQAGSRGMLNKVAVIGLEREFGIKLEEYELKPEKQKLQEEQQKTDSRKVSDLTADELAKLIYKAVYGAVIHAWENDDE